jgi:iron complex transport system substrate-binding protein
MTSGKKFFGQWWADAIGAVNVAQELTTDNSVAVNMEQIYAWDPELIFITNFTTAEPEDLYENTVGVYDWSGIRAVQERQVYKMPLGMYRSYTPGADTPVTLLWMAKTAYPEQFADIDILAETKAYYKEVFGVELTEAQAASIFDPTAEAGSGF